MTGNDVRTSVKRLVCILYIYVVKLYVIKNVLIQKGLQANKLEPPPVWCHINEESRGCSVFLERLMLLINSGPPLLSIIGLKAPSDYLLVEQQRNILPSVCVDGNHTDSPHVIAPDGVCNCIVSSTDVLRCGFGAPPALA